MFLNWIMLSGLAAVSVPIIIHLLNRRKFERVVWAAMRFLRVSVQQNQRRIKVEDLLLLIVRCLVLALLALALARPVLRGSSAAFGPSQVTAAILIDNSYSMSQSDGVQSRFALAKKAAEQVLKSLPANSSVGVYLVSDKAEGLIPEPIADLTLAAAKIKEAPLYDRKTDIFEGVRAAVAMLRRTPSAKKEIYVITDGQAGGWNRSAQIRQLLEESASELRCHFVLVSGGEEKNLGITSLRVDASLAAVNQPVRLEARVRNYGKAEAANVNVSIAVDGEPAMDQVTIGSIPAGEERSASLFARVRSEGYHSITAKLDGDHLPADDTRSVALRIVKQVKVLLVDGDSGREARESEVFFLKAALRPVPRSQWDDYFIRLTTKTSSELEATRFEDFDAVIAANVTDFSQTLVNQLAGYLKNGGALCVFPGDNVNRAFYNEQLYRRYAILPAQLGEMRGEAKNQEKWFSLADGKLDHEIVSLWRDPASGRLSAAKFFRVYDLVANGAAARTGDSAPAGQARVVARYADDKPAIMERDWGQGRVILFSSTADTEWNDLPARGGIFVPLVHRTLGRLVARQDEHLTVPVGGQFAHTAPVELLGKYATITKRSRPYSETAKDLNEMEESRQIELVDGVPLLRFDKLDLAGPYDVKVGDTLLARLAAQSDAEESRTEAIPDDQQKKLEEVAHVVRWTSGAPLSEALEQARIGSELWLPLAMAALILAAAETMLAHWFSKPK